MVGRESEGQRPTKHVPHGGLTPVSAEQALATPTSTEEFAQSSGLAQPSSGLGRPGESARASGLCNLDLIEDSCLGAAPCEALEPQHGARVSFFSAEVKLSDPR